MCKLAHVIRCTALSQNFHFCCFRAMAYIRLWKLWNWVQFCLFNFENSRTSIFVLINMLRISDWISKSSVSVSVTACSRYLKSLH